METSDQDPFFVRELNIFPHISEIFPLIPVSYFKGELTMGCNYCTSGQLIQMKENDHAQRHARTARALRCSGTDGHSYGKSRRPRRSHVARCADAPQPQGTRLPE